MAAGKDPRQKKAAPSAADELRRRAEERLDGLSAAPAPMPEDLAAIVHDLRVYQVELEMQNDELRRAQLELQASHEKYFELFDLAPVGYLTLSDKSIIRDANLTATRLLGAERRQLVEKPFTAFIFAPDQDVYYRRRRMLEESGEPQTCELRLRRAAVKAGADADAEAGHFWARLEGRPQPAVEGKTLSYWVTFTDVDEAIATQEALRKSAAELRTLIDTLPDLVWLKSPDGVFLSCNRRFQNYLGTTEKNIVGKTDYDFMDGDLADFFRQRDADAVAAGGPTRNEEEIVFAEDGHREVLETVKTPILASDGRLVGILGIGRDITARKRTEEELVHLNDELAAKIAALEVANATITRIAATDHLTGLANRRHVLEALDRVVSLVKRHGIPLTLISFDLDGLKRVNDSSGHEAGDKVLTSFAQLLASLCRIEDLPARLGGDEFIVLLPGIDQSGGRAFAERVRTATRSRAALAHHGVTVSGGSAQWSPGDLPVDLLRRADEALYAAKRGGGDSVAIES